MTPTHFPERDGITTHKYVLTVAESSASTLFISLPAIQAEIAQENIPHNRPIGQIVIRVRRANKLIEGIHIDSIGNFPLTKSSDLAHRLGLDVWAETNVERFLRSKYPKYKMIEHPHARTQSRSRSTAHKHAGEPVSIEQVYRITREHAQNILRAQRGMPPLSRAGRQLRRNRRHQ